MIEPQPVIPVHVSPVIVVEGPTASGKSDVAQRVASMVNGEVVSADSMQIYRGMNIGTAKLLEPERLVPHHLVDILDPGQAFSAQQYQVLARKTFKEIQERGHVAVLCGGTGLYVQAALEAMNFPSGEQLNNPVRAKYEALAHQQGDQAVWNVLHEVDSASAQVIHPHNVRRVIRALEMHEQGVSYADQVKNIRTLPEVVPSIRFALSRDPQVLANRINQRVDAMMEQGLVGEVTSLLQAGFREALTAPQAIGYKEIVAALEGTMALDEAAEQIKTATRRYAKRQRSWLRRDARLHWLDADRHDAASLAAIIVNEYQKKVR